MGIRCRRPHRRKAPRRLTTPRNNRRNRRSNAPRPRPLASSRRSKLNNEPLPKRHRDSKPNNVLLAKPPANKLHSRRNNARPQMRQPVSKPSSVRLQRPPLVSKRRSRLNSAPRRPPRNSTPRNKLSSGLRRPPLNSKRSSVPRKPLSSRRPSKRSSGPRKLLSNRRRSKRSSAPRKPLSSRPPDKLKSGASLYNLTRDLGGAIVLATIGTIMNDRLHFHWNRLIEDINPARPAVQQFFEMQTNRLDGMVQGDPGRAALRLLANTVQREALVMTFNDVIMLLSGLFVVGLVLMPLVRRPRSAMAR